MKKFLKKVLPHSVATSLNKYSKRNTYRKIAGYFDNRSKYETNGEKPIIYLIGTHTHENLGDQAISYAEKNFCQNKLSNFKIYEILDDDFFANLLCLKKYIRKNDVILLHGGGNVGVEYFEHELIRRCVISTFINNKILILPQTIDFGLSLKGSTEMCKSSKIYARHPRLYIFAREKYSYEIFKSNFYNNHILFSPDIVMYLNKQKVNERRNVVVCLRNDSERKISVDEIEQIKSFVNLYPHVVYTDMLWHKSFELTHQENILEEKWDLFRSAKCVITDRLHGMVFAAITGTPCIVFENYNHKVRGTFEWLVDLGYIYMAKSVTDAEKILKDIYKDDADYRYDNSFLIEYYEKIVEIVNSTLEG